MGRKMEVGENKERIILIRACRCDKEAEEEEVVYPLRRLDFLLMYMKIGVDDDPVVNMYCLPHIITRAPQPDLIVSGQYIYNLGGGSSTVRYLQPKDKSHQLYYYNGGSRIPFRIEEDPPSPFWDDIPMPENHPNSPVCVSLGGKIYSFGSKHFAPAVLLPSSEITFYWKPLKIPQHLVGETLSYSVALVDHIRGRILLHFSNDTLYAFYPPHDDDDEGNWVCVDTRFTYWSEEATLVDDVIFTVDYYFPMLVSAYDLGSRRLMRVSWATTTLLNGDNINPCRFNFDTLFSLGEGILCMAKFTRVEPTSTLKFFQFRAQRCPLDTSLMILTPLTLQTLHLDCRFNLFSFLPLHQPESSV